MIEAIMFFGIGFLVASVFGLVLAPLVHNRAVRLTMRRLEAATPLSMAEIQADKDQLRAEFAMSIRRLEMSVEQLKAKSTSQLGEFARKTEAISRLKFELGEKTATIFALEAREKALKEQIRATEQEYATKTSSMHEAERARADKEAALAKLSAEVSERAVHGDSQRVEIAALRTQVEALKTHLAMFEKDVKDTGDRLIRERSDADAATKRLAEERGKVENLGIRVVQLERQLAAQTTQAEILGRRVQDLESRLAEQGRLLVERESEANRLRSELETVRKTEADLRSELASAEARHRDATENVRTEKVRVENELEHVREEQAKLQREIATMNDAEATRAAERVESALLRERINDIAAEVARLTMALEGPDSPIEAILAEHAPERPASGIGGPVGNGIAGEKSNGSLADRIRALQRKASRVSPPS